MEATCCYIVVSEGERTWKKSGRRKRRNWV